MTTGSGAQFRHNDQHKGYLLFWLLHMFISDRSVLRRI